MGFIRPQLGPTFALPPGRRFPLDSLQEGLYILRSVIWLALFGCLSGLSTILRVGRRT